MRKKDKRKILIVLVFVVAGIILILAFWRTPWLLAMLLGLTSYLKHRLSPVRNELLMFVVAAMLGTVMESILIERGVWSYGQPGILSFPIWLPFAWGLACSVWLTLYSWLTGLKM